MRFADRRRPRVIPAFWPEAILFLAALGVRLIPEMINGAVTGNYGYDPAVYYAAADSLLQGRTPYRDFILLHPPGIVLVDAPFAWFGSITDDRLGFAALTGFFALLSATSAVLVTRVARRMGMPRLAGLVAGTVYALWFGSLIAQYEPRLEPLTCFLLLCGLLALLAAKQADRSGRASLIYALLAGAGFGATISVKIWWSVPVGVLLVWELAADRAVRRVGAIVGGMASAMLLINGPFLLAAGSKMWTMVVQDQLGRPRNTPHLLRPAYLVFGWPAEDASKTEWQIGVGLGAALLVVLVLRAWRLAAARAIVLILLAQVALLVLEPTWFPFYADYITVALSLVVGAACVRRAAPVAIPRRPSPRPRPRPVEPPTKRRGTMTRDASPWIAAGIAVALGTAIAWTVPEKILVTGVPGRRLAAAAQGYRCVMTDSPMALIDMNLLTTQLRRGCPNRVDVTGLIFELDRHEPDRDLVYERWNANMISYLRAGDAMLFFRPPRALALVPGTAREVQRDGAIAQVGRFTLYRVVDGSGAEAANRTGP